MIYRFFNFNQMVATRFVIDILLLVFSLTMPWWLVVVAIVVAAMIFGSFYEAIFLGFCFDLLYSPMSDGIWIINFYGTIIGIFIFSLAEILKRHLLFYNR